MRKQDRPNILVVMADQWRHDYLGCAGAGFARTPNIDALAARGALISHCCTDSPICAPARMSLATGLDPERFGGTGNTRYLPRHLPTYYQRLRDADYRVGCVGKLDLAKSDEYNGVDGRRPSVFRWGFTHPLEVEGKMHAGRKPEVFGPYTAYLHERGLLQAFHDDYRQRKRDWARSCGDSVLPREAWADCWIGQRSADWIRAIPEDYPWHLFVSFVGPHDPFDPPAEDGARWRDAAVPEAFADELAQAPDWLRRKRRHSADDLVARCRRQYLACCEVIDEQLGRILQALDERGMRDNTYVVFSSDHGEMLGDHGLWQKSVPYDPALRVPLIAAGPGIPAGRRSDALVSLMDLGATCCDWAGLPPQEAVDARSCAAVFAGERDRHRDGCLSTLQPFRLWRTPRHCLVQYHAHGTALFDCEQDPRQLHDISADEPALCRELSAQLDARVIEGAWSR